jgi:hypothetical protein
VADFDWHRSLIDRATPITKSYRHTQNVRRFFRAACGPDFAFDRPFMAWLKNGAEKTMGDAVDEWLRRTETALSRRARRRAAPPPAP